MNGPQRRVIFRQTEEICDWKNYDRFMFSSFLVGNMKVFWHLIFIAGSMRQMM